MKYFQRYFFFLSDNTLRLVGGQTPYEGRVEVYHNGVWGTICDDSWTAKDTTFVCQAFGFSA